MCIRDRYDARSAGFMGYIRPAAIKPDFGQGVSGGRKMF